MTICEEKGYHSWSDEVPIVQSIEEDCEEMTLTTKCTICGASFEGKGYWTEVD